MRRSIPSLVVTLALATAAVVAAGAGHRRSAVAPPPPDRVAATLARPRLRVDLAVLDADGSVLASASGTAGDLTIEAAGLTAHQVGSRLELATGEAVDLRTPPLDPAALLAHAGDPGAEVDVGADGGIDRLRWPLADGSAVEVRLRAGP